MAKIVTWFMSTLTAVVLLFGYHTSTSGAVTATPAVIGTTTAGTSSSSSSSGTTSSAGSGSGSDDTGSSSTGSGSTSSDSAGTVTGAAVDTRYGPVQVEVTTDDSGSITDVQVVQYPANDHKDIEINSYALPVLIQETIDAQSADIDMVSGATYTSQGYIGSLQDALDQL
ncbi:MAG: FMN-binding protein [Nocardioides sp.]|nr:FMN-binding protein [Nocardioides sp.]